MSPANMVAATEAVRFHDSRPDLAWEHPETVRCFCGDQISDPSVRPRHRLPFVPGELFIQIEAYTSPEDAQIATSATQNRFGLVCTAKRFVETTGRDVQVGDTSDMQEAQQDALYSKFTCEGPQGRDSYIHSFHIRMGGLESVTTVYCPSNLLRKGLLTSSQIRRLWVGVGHHVHGIVMEFEDGTHFGEMLYDDGTRMQLPASQAQIELRATAFVFLRGESFTKVCSVKSTLTKFPLHSVIFTLHNGAVMSCNGSNSDEDAHVVCDQGLLQSQSMMNKAS